MSLRLPDRLNGEDRTQRSVDNVLGEIAVERAATSARMSERVERALSQLQACGPNDDRKRLVDVAANALWELVVQREAAGMPADLKQLARDFDVPREVIARFGHHPTR